MDSCTIDSEASIFFADGVNMRFVQIPLNSTTCMYISSRDALIVSRTLYVQVKR